MRRLLILLVPSTGVWQRGSTSSRSMLHFEALNICECMPPACKIGTEYHCIPGSSSDNWPLVGSRTLVHMLKCPRQINETETWIFNRVPKRTRGELRGSAKVPAEGWGLYFEEGWDVDMILSIIILDGFGVRYTRRFWC
jgi:hypothetical protein